MSEPKRREFLKAALAALAGVSTVSCRREPTAMCYAAIITQESLPAERALKRAELVKRLEKLAKSEPPKLLMGAECYDPVYVYTEKPCSTCERTMIVGEKDEILRRYNVPLKRIQDHGVDATLIVIPKHCPECGDGLTKEKFQLEIKYPDYQDVVRVKLDDAYDLELMALFLAGCDRFDKQAWIGGGGDEQPLKDMVVRLKELFGVAEKE